MTDPIIDMALNRSVTTMAEFRVRLRQLHERAHLAWNAKDVPAFNLATEMMKDLQWQRELLTLPSASPEGD